MKIHYPLITAVLSLAWAAFGVFVLFEDPAVRFWGGMGWLANAAANMAFWNCLRRQ